MKSTKERNEYMREWYAKNKVERCLKRNEWASNNKDVVRSSQLKYKYKMTLEEYETKVKEQNGVCALCNTACRTRKNLSVDHDHRCCPGTRSCGKCIRGLICNECNSGLGRFGDSKELLARAIEYLEHYEIS